MVVIVVGSTGVLEVIVVGYPGLWVVTFFAIALGLIHFGSEVNILI